MNIYLVRNPNHYDNSYTSMVVVADDENEARNNMHPDMYSSGTYGVTLPGKIVWNDYFDKWMNVAHHAQFDMGETWPDPQELIVELIGIASPGRQKGVLCSDFLPGEC